MKTISTKSVFTAIGNIVFSALLVFSMAACDNGSGTSGNNNNGKQDPQPTFQTEFELTAWEGKTITVIDERTGSPDKNLKELGVITKLQEAVDMIGAVGDDIEQKQGFNRMLGKNVKIVVKDSDGSYNENKTRPSENALWLNFDWLTNPETNNIALVLIVGIGRELDKGNEYSW